MATSAIEPSLHHAGGPPDLAVVVLARTGANPDVTLDSLVRQEGVTLRVLVAGDIAVSSTHHGVRLERVRGEISALRDALGGLDADFVTFVRAGDILLQGSLRALCDTLGASPHAVLAHAFWLPLDPDGRMSRGAVRAHLARLRETFSSAEHGGPAHLQGLPTLRRDWILSGANFAGGSLGDALDRAGRAAARSGTSTMLKEAACAIPRHDAPLLPARGARARARDALGRWGRPARYLLDRVARMPVVAPIAAARRLPPAWEIVGASLRRWGAFDSLKRSSPRGPRAGTERVAYVLWRYPTLSETFIRREVEGLREAGLSLEVFALEPENSPAAVDHVSSTDQTTYFGPAEWSAGRAFILQRLRRQPLTVIRLWLYVVRLRAGSRSTWWRDRDVLYLAAQLASALKNAGITHVHAPWAGPYAIIGFVAARLIGVTFSAQARASEIHRRAQAPGVADRLRFAEFIVTNSAYNERYLRGLLGPEAPPVHVIYNGLDLHRFPAAEARKRETGPYRVLAVGRLVEPKGFKYLLHACRLLSDRGVDVTCDIVGGPVDPSDTMTWLELRLLRDKLELGPKVRFLGAQRFTSVLEAFQRADVFVLPCLRARDGSHDITPNSLIEAMAMRLPVISTTSGAIPEIVDHEVNGLLVPPGDAAALADALARLLGDPELRRRLGAAARRKVEERFEIGRNVPRRLELFRSLGTQEP